MKQIKCKDVGSVKVKIIVDSRENVNQHITDAFEKHEVDYEVKKVEVGDYSMYVPEFDYTCKMNIERKASLSELAGNLMESRDENNHNRFERELIKAKELGIKVVIMIEEECNENWYENLINHRYRSKLNPNSFRGMLMSLSSRYDVSIVGIPKQYAGSFIFNTLAYQLREELKVLRKEGVLG